MASTQQVVINITARGNTRQIREARRELLKLAAAGQIANTTQTSLQKRFDKIDRRAKMLKNTLSGLGKMLSSMNKIALKLFTIGFAAGAAILPLVNALFATGRVLVNLYRSSMSLLAAAVAAVGAALAGAAAAMREYTAAVQAYNFKSSPALNNRLFESRAALRGLQDDAVLASFGMQALNQAFATMSKSGQVNAASKNMLKGLADFAAAGGDPSKNLAAAAEFVGLLQKSGKLDQKALQAAEQLGPTFVDALKKARDKGVSTFSDLYKMIQSGELSALGGVEGQAGIVGGTVMGRFKALMTEMQVMAADFGQSLLGPIKVAMTDIGRIIERLFARVGPEMIAFGRGGVLNTLVNVIDKLANFSVRLFREYLPGVNGMMGRLASWWQKVLYWFNDFTDGLRSLLPLGSAVIEAFGKPFMAIFQTVGGWIQYVGESVKNNQKTYNKFGDDLLKFIQKIQDVGKQFIDIFTEALPTIDKFLGFISTAVDMVMTLARAFGFVGEAIATMTGGGGQGMGAFVQMISLMLLGGGLRSFARGIRGGGGVLASLPYGMGGAIGRAQTRYGSRGVPGPNAQGGYGAAQYGPAVPGRLPLTYQQVYADARSRGMSVPGAAIVAQQQFGMKGPSGFAGWGRMGSAFFKGARYGQNPFAASRRALGRHVQSGGIVPGARYAGLMRGIGPAAMMGVGSMFAAKEAQPSLMTGAAIASLAPFLGPAAAFGGMAFGGIGAMMKSRTAGGGAAMGALGGAGVGGAIGMIGGPVGMVIGSVLGAATGAVIGYFKGKSNGEKLKAKKAAGDFMNTVYKDISKDLFKGDTDGIRKTLSDMRRNVERISGIAALGEGMGRGARRAIFGQQRESGAISQAEYDALVAAPGTYRRELEDMADTTEKVLVPMINRFDDTAKTVENALGITTDKLMEMANAAGVNLYDDTVKLTDTLKALGLAVNYTGEQIKGALRDIQIGTTERLQRQIDIAKSGEAMDEMTEAIYQAGLEGPIDLQDLGNYISDFLNQLNIRNPNAFFRNIEYLNLLFGEDGAAFGAGQQLEGLGDIFAPIQPMLAGMRETMLTEGRENLVDTISRQLLFAGIGVDRAQLTEMIGGMSSYRLDRLVADLAAGKLDPSKLGTRYGRRGAVADYTSTTLENIGLGGLTTTDIELGAMTLEQKIAAFGEEGVAIMEGMNKVIEAAFTSKPDWMVKPPDWYSKESFQALLEAKDTTTPRGSRVGDTVTSRLGRTMSRHNFFDSKLAGRRNVTSSYRNYGLGSINSDHVTGRAYDLTGDNLGAYSTMVNRMGGFAEFHGVGGSRHLHVVPGETPAGDTTAPYMNRSAIPMTGGATTNNYNVVVNAAPGMDVNSLANAVIERIQRVERQNAERS